MDAVRIIRWESLTKRAFDALDRERTVVLLTCSPLEVHGPHLPMGADALQGEALVERALRFLPERHRERPFLKAPLVYVASDVVAQPGSLDFSPPTTVRVLCELGATLARQGFRDVVVSNFHGGRRHVLAIERACERANRRHGMRMISLFSVMRRRMAQRASGLRDVIDGVDGVTTADFRGDTHAGVLETSQLLALYGDWVDPGYRALPRRTFDEWAASERGRGGLRALLRRIGLVRPLASDHAYFALHSYSGAPAVASAELGEKLLDALAEESARGLAELLDGTARPEAFHGDVVE